MLNSKTSERLKALPTVTAANLERAVEDGCKQLGHSSVGRMVVDMENMTWKTSAGSHIDQILALAPLLISMFQVCTNGLVPDALLQISLRALWSAGKLQVPEPMLKTPNWEEAALSYLNLRLRMVAAKLREIATSTTAWAATTRKLDASKLETLRAVCQILSPQTPRTAPMLAIEDWALQSLSV